MIWRTNNNFQEEKKGSSPLGHNKTYHILGNVVWGQRGFEGVCHEREHPMQEVQFSQQLLLKKYLNRVKIVQHDHFRNIITSSQTLIPTSTSPLRSW